MTESGVAVRRMQSASGDGRHGHAHAGVVWEFPALLLCQNLGKMMVRKARQAWGGAGLMTPLEQQKDFEDFEASLLFCPTCKRAMPVRKRLLLVLLDKEIFDYICTGCGSAVGKKEQPWRRPAQWSGI